jgi:hypothetical protein
MSQTGSDPPPFLSAKINVGRLKVFFAHLYAKPAAVQREGPRRQPFAGPLYMPLAERGRGVLLADTAMLRACKRDKKAIAEGPTLPALKKFTLPEGARNNVNVESKSIHAGRGVSV